MTRSLPIRAFLRLVRETELSNRRVSAWSRKAGNETGSEQIVAHRDNWDGAVGFLNCPGSEVSECDDKGRLHPDQLSYLARELLDVFCSIPKLDRNILSWSEA